MGGGGGLTDNEKLMDITSCNHTTYIIYIFNSFVSYTYILKHGDLIIISPYQII